MSRAPAGAGLRVAVLGVTALLLAGCAGDARSSARDAVAEITEDANSRDADAVRRGVDELEQALIDAVGSGELDGPEADPIIAAARAVRERATLIEEQEPEPTEEPTPEPTEEPEPGPTAEPEPEPTGEPEPEPTGEPEPTEEPEDEPEEQEDDDDEPDEDDEVVPTVPVPVSPS